MHRICRYIREIDRRARNDVESKFNMISSKPYNAKSQSEVLYLTDERRSTSPENKCSYVPKRLINLAKSILHASIENRKSLSHTHRQIALILNTNLSKPILESTNSRCVHTTAFNLSLGADSNSLSSPGGGSEESVQDKIDKWKAGIDFEQLTAAHKSIHKAHLKAMEEDEEIYMDPATDFEVITIKTHFARGSCCGNVCRHCPYNHVNAPKEYRELMRHNTAFYC